MRQEKLVQKVLDILKRNKVDFVVVGGYAWERNIAPAGTVDLDVMVLSRDYDRMLEDIPLMLRREHINAELIEREPVMSLIRITHRGVYLELEVLDSQYYSAEGRDFLVYAKQYRSNVIDGVYYARPELVWYMRLCIPDWNTYITKCVREFVLGYRHKGFLVKTSDILEISKVFSTEQKIRPRIKALKGYLQHVL